METKKEELKKRQVGGGDEGKGWEGSKEGSKGIQGTKRMDETKVVNRNKQGTIKMHDKMDLKAMLGD